MTESTVERAFLGKFCFLTTHYKSRGTTIRETEFVTFDWQWGKKFLVVQLVADLGVGWGLSPLQLKTYFIIFIGLSNFILPRLPQLEEKKWQRHSVPWKKISSLASMCSSPQNHIGKNLY